MPRSLVPPSGARERERQGKEEEEVGDGGWYGEREIDRVLEGGLAGARGWKRGVCSGR